jgi:D-serine deaminase-like pyridoxal phosphate-dependent protein
MSTIDSSDVLSAAERFARYADLVADEPLPVALVDLDALDANIAALVEACAPGVSLRAGTKSIRVPELLRHIRERSAGRVRGLMTYSADETAFLAERGFDDFLLAYPVGRPREAELLASLAARGVRVRVVVDSPEHVALLEHAGRAHGIVVDACLDLDMSLRLLGGLVHLGVRRSPIRDADDALTLAYRIRHTKYVRLAAIMGYEAQIAGLDDEDPARRMVKAASQREVRARRGAVLAALEDAGFRPSVINGGGTGSVPFTSSDPSVTEVTAGSGFLCSHLFDGYDALDLRPALFFALPVVRRSDAGMITCASGGFIASGPPGADRAPRVVWPEGLAPLALEGFGEVQTPLAGPSADALDLGDAVWCRPAKAGEIAERFDRYLLVRGTHLEGRADTYRGLGLNFG